MTGPGRRAKIVLYAAEGQSDIEIVSRLDTSAGIVGRWRRRFCVERLDGLKDRPRAGARVVFPRSAYENLRPVHLPIHASRLNQIELYFSIVQRKALTPNDFGSWRSPASDCSPSRSTTRRSPALSVDVHSLRPGTGAPRARRQVAVCRG
jgi:Helix-turn-helix domain